MEDVISAHVNGAKRFNEERFIAATAPMFPRYYQQRKTFKEFLKDSTSALAMNASYDGVPDVPALEIIR